MGLGKRNYAGEAAKRQAIASGRLRPRRPVGGPRQVKPAFGTLGHAQGLGIGARPQILGYDPSIHGGIGNLHRERGGSGNRIQGLSDVAGSRQRDLRTRASNETSGMGAHLGKHTGHTQVIHATNAATANQPRTDHGGTDFLSSSGGNPAVPNHRPHNSQRGTHPIAPIDARAMVSQDGGLKLAKQHKS